MGGFGVGPEVVEDVVVVKAVEGDEAGEERDGPAGVEDPVEMFGGFEGGRGWVLVQGVAETGFEGRDEGWGEFVP